MTLTLRELGALREIRAILATLAPLEIGEVCYLKLEDLLSATEPILYPAGLQTEEQYRRLIAISKAGCKAIGYSDEEITLLPPVVSCRLEVCT